MISGYGVQLLDGFVDQSFAVPGLQVRSEPALFNVDVVLPILSVAEVLPAELVGEQHDDLALGGAFELADGGHGCFILYIPPGADIVMCAVLAFITAINQGLGMNILAGNVCKII